MSASPVHSLHHPRWLRRRMSTYWWLERRSYLLFILRELSSVSVAWTALLILMIVAALGDGADAYRQLLARLGGPGWLALHALALAFLVLHSVTWFRLAPQAMVMRARGRRIPGALVAGAHFAAWLVVSAGIAWLIVRA
jgi:fumarate reductase subunit C